jgi:dienelactone hydrolase
MTSLEKLTFEHAGKLLAGEVARPSGQGPFPAVLVMANALGLGQQTRESAAELAEQGYLAVATDMFGDGAFFADPTKAGDDYMTLMSSPTVLRARVVAWFETVAALPDVDASRIAAIGYCFGGCCVLELARSGVDVKAVVSYHGILTTENPAAAGAIKGEVSAYCGGQDPYAPEETIDGLHRELTAAGASHHITVFANAKHGFTDTTSTIHGHPGIAYDAIAHCVSWAGTLALLETVFRG